MTPAVTRIRRDLEAEREHHIAALHLLDAQLDVVGRIEAALQEPEPKPPKPRDLRAEVYRALTGEPQSAGQIAVKIGRCKLSVIRQHLNWQGKHGNALFLDGGWLRADLLPIANLQAAAE